MNERIKLLIIEKGLSASKFADVIGVQASGISHIISGRNKPGYDFIVKVLDNFPEIDPDWLLMGKGSMFRDEAAASNLSVHDDSLFADNISGSAGHKPIRTNEAEVSQMPPQQVNNTLNNSPLNTADITPKGSEASNIMQPAEQPSVNENRNRKVESVIIFYSDKSFSTYRPAEE